MEPLTVGILGVVALFAMMVMGMPIGVAMGLTGFLGFGFIVGFGTVGSKLAWTAFNTASYVIAIFPLFGLMAFFAANSGVTSGAYYAMHKWLARMPGGLSIASVGGCAAFSATIGSSTLCSATMAAVALPEMRRYNYAPSLALGSLAAGGTLGILIPPSGGMILYGIMTEQSIGKLFMAGIFPGILLALLFMITIYIWAKLNPSLGPRGPKASWRESLAGLKDFWAIAVLFLVVMGGIYGGVFTPTEAGACGAVTAFIIGIATRRLNKAKIVASFTSMFRMVGMIFVILIGAMIFGYFLTASTLAMALADFITGLTVPTVGILVCMLFLFLVLGCVMDAYAMIMIVIPILFPTVLALGIDPIWFAVLTVIMMEMGLITPPVGMNVFVMHGMAGNVPLYTIFRGILPFAIAMAVCAAIVIAFPQIALFLPYTMK